MSKLREAAWAVIERWNSPLWKDLPATAAYISELRQALEAPDELETLRYEVDAIPAIKAERDALQAELARPESTAVSLMRSERDALMAAANREPLSDEKIDQIMRTLTRNTEYTRRKAARAIEAAHGIGAKP